jgi:hypothetical protein
VTGDGGLPDFGADPNPVGLSPDEAWWLLAGCLFYILLGFGLGIPLVVMFVRHIQ